MPSIVASDLWPRAWAVLIGDVVQSRQSPDRAALQRRLQATLEQANRRLLHHQDLELDRRYYKGMKGKLQTNSASTPAPELQVTVGDEFQGLFAWPADAIQTAIEVWEAMAPQKVAFGLGWGTISTDLDPAHIGNNDGPCFHAARAALSWARQGGLMMQVAGFDVLGPGRFRGRRDDQANRVLQLTSRIRSRWTPRQIEVIRAVRSHSTDSAAAVALGVRPSTVAESLQASMFQDVETAEAAVVDLLNENAQALYREEPQ